MGAYAFSGCTVLIGIDLPSGVKTIGNYAFQNCKAIASVDFPSSLTSIGQYAYSGCTALAGVTIGNGITLGNYVFSGCTSLATATIGGSVSLGTFAFSECTALAAVTIESGSHVGSYAFSGCTALNSAILPSGVTVGQGAFVNCYSLASVVLPEDMTTIPGYCFRKCTNLASIIWPTALTTISYEAFAGCRFADNNYSLQLPTSVTTIENFAFGGLRHLVLPSTSAITIAENSFLRNYNTFLYVPANMVEMYKMCTYWSNYADRIRPISDYPLESIPVGGAIGEPIDLGLSVKWASWNIGASAPEEYGAHFAWGETEIDWDYDWANYKWCNGSSTTLTKYNTKSTNGSVDNKTTLDLEDDAARANWGGTWRMPTDAEWTELRENCTWTWTTVNGIKGHRVTSTTEGFTDKYIFLPAAGSRGGLSLSDVGSQGDYWSSSLSTDGPYGAWYVSFVSSTVLRNHNWRYPGYSVRPVCPKE